MVKFADRAKAKEQDEEMPKICGVEECFNKCDVIIGYMKIARCSECYQKDIDTCCGRRQSSSAFVFEKGMPRL